MASYWKIIHEVLRKADILLMVLDARMVSETRNLEIEEKVQQTGKPYLYVINKADLIDIQTAKAYKQSIPHAVFISSKNHQGVSKLREKIQVYAARANLHEQIKVGVLGYPNVGKSSIINALSGKHGASVSALSGHTRSLKKIRATSKIMLLDTPGVIPYKENDEIKHAMIGSTDYSKEKEPDVIVMFLMEEFPRIIEKYYGVPYLDDKSDTLDAIAAKRNMKSKGGLADIQRTATMILKDWQTGKIKGISHR
ncbi:GTPase RsgA [Candidatus Woesearchaeota archaeon]|nr:MAG: GTPase RsgA [Candidatus Woesearchaeota archaeon]